MSKILSNKDRKTWARHRRIANKKQCIVYGLHAGDDVIRYIGQTQSHPDDRLRFHRKHSCSDGTPVQRWVFEHGDAIGLEVLCDAATWDVTEIIMIERCRIAGVDLLNLTRGGQDTYREARRCAEYKYPW